MREPIACTREEERQGNTTPTSLITSPLTPLSSHLQFLITIHKMPASTQPTHDQLAPLIEKGDVSTFQSSLASSDPSQNDLVLLLHVACSHAQKGYPLSLSTLFPLIITHTLKEIVDTLLAKGVAIDSLKGRGRSVTSPLVSALSSNTPVEFVSLLLVNIFLISI